MPTTNTRAVDLEAGQIVWSLIVEFIDPEGDDYALDWIELHETVGSAGLRAFAVELGAWCREVADHCRTLDANLVNQLHYSDELLPEILDHARDGHGDILTDAEHLPSAETTADAVVRLLHRRAWMRQLQTAMISSWGDSDAIHTARLEINAAYASGLSPAEALQSLPRVQDWTANSLQ